MKFFVCLMAITLLVSSSALSQDRARMKGSAQADGQAQAQKSDQSLMLDAGTQLSAELLTTLDAKKAKPGDEFKMRTLKPIVVEGKQVISKGAVLTGQVIETSQAEGKNGVSHLKLGFNQLQNKNLTMPFSATIQQITRATIDSQAQANDMATAETNVMTSSRSTASGRSNGGGLLGGATGAVVGTVGSAIGTTTSTVNDTVGNVATGVQQTSGSVVAISSETLNSTSANAQGLISITSETSAETSGQANGNSMLSLAGRNVKVEKGAVFLLRTDKSMTIASNKER